MMAHTLFVLLDGMEDDPNPALGGRKPYEVADMPFIRSKCPYLNYTEGKAYTQLFLNEFWTGHPPETPRAALEAAGLGMDVSDGRKAFRMSPAWIRDGTVVWAYGVEDEFPKLRDSVLRNLDVFASRKPEIECFDHGRSVITMMCPDDVPDGPQAPVDGPSVPLFPDMDSFISKVASETGGLTVFPWGVGSPRASFPCYPGIEDMVAVSNSPTALGVAATLGHGIVFVEDLRDRPAKALEALEDHDVFLHFDEVDEYSHQKDHTKKIAVLEEIDRLMGEYFRDTERIVVFVDHGTSCVTGNHILMEVPFRSSMDVFGNGNRFETGEVVPLATEEQR